VLLFSAQNLKQTLGGGDIFNGVSFELKQGEKLALVGPNGVGKSSLLRIIAGVDEAVGGKIHYYSNVTCAFLPQFPETLPGTTVIESLAESYTGSSLHSVGEALKKFGFNGRENQPIVNLSGGEKTRLRLAGIWNTEADLLLLDEPTNHLDIQNMDWLEAFIMEYPHTLIVVSHDRHFLDHTVKRVLELTPHGVVSYPGNYTAYHQARTAKLVQDEKTWREQAKAARKLDQAIKEQKSWAGKAHDHAAAKARQSGIKSSKVHYRSQAKKTESRVKNNIKRLDRLREKQIDRPNYQSTIDLSFKHGTRANNAILRAEGLAKSFGTHPLFNDTSFTLNYGEKAAVIGANGTGKTTLLRMIGGWEAQDEGELWLSPSLRIGYLEQEIHSLDDKRIVLDELLSVQYDPGRVRSMLADLLLCREAVYKPCGILSMGERVRVALARLLLGTYDLLLLDEPGNYLDLPSREKLEDALQTFQGSIILVSHDRYMVERVASATWAIENRKVQVYSGTYSAYQASKQSKNKASLDWETRRLELEIKKALLISQLSLIDRKKNEDEYRRLEDEYLETLKNLRASPSSME